MKFVSIRQKLIRRGSLIFILSFVGLLSIVALMNVNIAKLNQRNSETSIRSSLVAKGRTLVNNNSQALRGLVADNAYSAVRELVSTTVRDDDDLVYGIFMDPEKSLWVYARKDNADGMVMPGEQLDDETTRWALGVTEVSYLTRHYNGAEVYEFAAPVRADGSSLGVIRYGITTASMQRSLQESADAARGSLYRMILILLGVGAAAVTIGIFSMRRMAQHITTPLLGLTQSAATIAAGNYNTDVGVGTDDEIGVLANNFDLMRATIKKKIADLARLNHTGEVLATLLDQYRAQTAVLASIIEQLGVDNAAVYLRSDSGELDIRARLPQSATPALAEAHAAEEAGFLQQCARTRQSLYRRHAQSGSAQRDRAAVCIPLLDGDELIGVLLASGPVASVRFDESDHEFSASIARLLVITLKNIRMRETIEEQNRTLEQKVALRTQELQSTMQALEAEKTVTEKAYQALDKANQQLLSSIEYARRIQHAVLPDKRALGNAVKDIAVWWQPLHVVGGDYFWLEQFDDLSVILVADCTGHGVPGAFITLVLASALDRILHEQAVREPVEILQRVDDMVRARLRQDKPEADSDDGLDAALCVWNRRTHELRFAGARLPLWFLRKGMLQELKSDRVSLGYCSRNTTVELNEQLIKVEPGDLFYLHTDGVPDHMGGTPRKLMGKQRLSQLILQNSQLPLPEQIAHIQQELERYRGEEPRRDDTTLIVLQPL